MKRLVREPLLHFLVLGALLFVLYGWLNRNGFDSPNEIVVTNGQVETLRQQFERVWQRQPTAVELQGLVNNWVRDEIFYREGVAMGLDRDDPIVRRRIGQKVQFIADAAAPQSPTEEELQRWLDDHSDKYRIEARYSLQQIYFNPQQHGKRLELLIEDARGRLAEGRSVSGDVTMLPTMLTQQSASEVARVFGSEFEQGLRSMSAGTWQGPVRSGFGFHLVRLTDREESRRASLAEVREAVERDVQQAQLAAASEYYYRGLRANYSVRIEVADSSPGRPAG